jgi:hypothetical protein
MTDHYRELFRETGDRLTGLAKTLRSELMFDDVAGLFLAIGIAELSRALPPSQIAARLRDLADSVDIANRH